MAKKKAFIVGINYTNTGNDLHGCINDAKMMEALLRTKYQFTDIQLCLEKDATTANIKAGLEALVADAKPGDVLFFHYSGHGSQIYDGSDDDFEPDGLDEILCPIDIDWRTKIITDDYLKSVFDRVPQGVNVTVILDCCHSGGALDQLEYYQPIKASSRQITEQERGRFLPSPDFVSVPEQFKQKALEANVKKRNIMRSINNNMVLLITGCQSHQTSADAFINNNFYGACTFYLNEVLKENNYNISYKALVEQLNQKMVRNNFTQRPELNGLKVFYNCMFLQPATKEVLENDVIETTIDNNASVSNHQSQQNNTQSNQEKNQTLLFVAGIIILLLLVISALI